MATKKILIQIQVGAKDANIAVSKVEKALSGLSSAQVKVAETTKNARAQSRLNNAILLETGRLASDASFGFTAIANNLSQVVTLMSSFIETNGSAIESFKQLGRSLIGTGGFLILVQLLISFGPKLLDMLTGTTRAVKDLRKAQEDAAKAAGEQIGRLETLSIVLNDVTRTYGEKQAALDELNKEHKELNLQLNEEGILTEESREAIEDYIPVLKKKAQAQAFMSLIQQKYGELIEIENQRLIDNIGFFDKLMIAIKSGLGIEGAVSDAISKSKEKRQEAIAEIQQEIESLTQSFLALGEFGDRDDVGVVKAFKGIRDVVVDEDLFNGMTRLQINAQDALEGAGDSAVKGLSVLNKGLTEQTKAIKKATKDNIKLTNIEKDSKIQAYNDTGNALVALGQLAGRQTGVGKGLAIAGTLISTYAAAQKAYQSQFDLPVVDAPLRAAIAAAAAVAQGLANVAAIRKIKTPSGGGGVGSQSGGDTTVEAPDFNVVGASETSQLATSLAGVTGRPIQAFVVGKQVTTQQELDRNITTTARIN